MAHLHGSSGRTPTVLCAVDVGWDGSDDPDGGTSRPFISSTASAALRVADWEARHHQSALTLIHVLPVTPGAPMSPAGVASASIERERLVNLIVGHLTQAAAELIVRAPADINILVEDGPPDEAIALAAERLAAGLVVLGAARDPHAVRRVLLGRVVAGVVRRAGCSVMVVCVKPNGGSVF